MALRRRSSAGALGFALLAAGAAAQGLLPSCDNASYLITADPAGECGSYKCACIPGSDCETGSSYCPCPFLYKDVSQALKGGVCQCLLANLCGPTCPPGYLQSGDQCLRSTTGGAYSITLVNMGAPADYDAIFAAAANRWESIITADLVDYPAPVGGWFQSDGFVYTEDVDDIVIGYMVEPMDGPGGALAELPGDPTDGLPLSGRMRFDLADVEAMVADGTIQAVITHEMGHVLGIGTLWPTPAGCASSCNVYDAGAPAGECHASDAFTAMGLVGELLVESNGTPDDGTYCTHWSEAQLASELMTGVFDPAVTYNPLTAITIGSLEDLGYTVDYSQAEPLVQPGARRALDAAAVAAAAGRGLPVRRMREYELIRPATVALPHPDAAAQRSGSRGRSRRHAAAVADEDLRR